MTESVVMLREQGNNSKQELELYIENSEDQRQWRILRPSESTENSTNIISLIIMTKHLQ